MGISKTGLGEMSGNEVLKNKTVKTTKKVESEDGEFIEQKEKMSGAELRDEIKKLIQKRGYQLSEKQFEDALKDLGIEDSQYYMRKEIIKNVVDYFETRKKK